MGQTRIPCLLMRGGTSKGAYFCMTTCPPLARCVTGCCWR